MTNEIEDGELNSDPEQEINLSNKNKISVVNDGIKKLNKSELDDKLNNDEKNELNKLLNKNNSNSNANNESSSESGELSAEDDLTNNPYDQEDVRILLIKFHKNFKL
jgi:hypothetical protein